MKAVIQRVKQAEVRVDGKVVSRIERGLLTLLGVAAGDDSERAEKLIQKICALRIFEDQAGKMNLSLQDIGGEHLIVSQFTIVGDCTTGRRPSFTSAAPPAIAKPIYEKAIELSAGLGIRTSGGVFQADMEISLINDGPVTFVIEV